MNHNENMQLYKNLLRRRYNSEKDCIKLNTIPYDKVLITGQSYKENLPNVVICRKLLRKDNPNAFKGVFDRKDYEVFDVSTFLLPKNN